MARIEEMATPENMAVAISSEIDHPTGIITGPGELDLNNLDAASAICQAMTVGHIGE